MALDYERSGVGTPASIKRMVETLVQFCNNVKRDGAPLSNDPNIRKKLAKIALDAEVLRLMCYRVTSIQTKKNVPNYEASLTKVFSSELLDRAANLGIEILGPYGNLDRGSIKAPFNGSFARSFLHSPSMGIGGGTSEIQRNIIAMRGLGLPRQ
jgi:alkylation response protein AidB-like acyl-CoA dehydrogenase